MPKAILVVSDLHCGSTVGLCPPDFETQEGQKIGLSDWQRWMWDRWLEMREYAKTKYGKLDALVINGDCIDGDHHKTVQIWSKNVGDHLNAAYHSLLPLAELAKHVFVVLGTEIHTRDMEHALANLLGADRQSKERPAFDRLEFEAGGNLVVAVHHMPATSRAWLRANALGMELANHRLHAAEVGERVPDVLLLAHRHQYGGYDDHAGHVYSTPPWIAPTRYAYRVAPAARWTVGGLFLELEPGHVRPDKFIRRPRSGRVGRASVAVRLLRPVGDCL